MMAGGAKHDSGTATMKGQDTGRTILVVGFWGLAEPLTRSTLLPTVECLLRRADVDRVVLATVERGDRRPDDGWLPADVVHRPLRASRLRPKALARLVDLLVMPTRLEAIAREFQVGSMIARTTMAGTIACPVARTLGLPVIVESLEPHAEYMVECGEWSAHGPFAVFTRWSERRQLQQAHRLLVVSAHFREYLVREGIAREKIHLVRCPVDLKMFAFNDTDRQQVREGLGWHGCIVGVYVGKFGGLYHREWAFRAFAKAMRHFGDRARLVVLTAEPREEVLKGLRAEGLADHQVHVDRVTHEEVPRWLSAADFAFSTYRGTPSSAFLSPVKNGEYWANGLPILLTRGVSDDSDLIEADPNAGAVFDPEGDDLLPALDHIAKLIAQPDQRERTMAFGVRVRPPDALDRAYQEALGPADVPRSA